MQSQFRILSALAAVWAVTGPVPASAKIMQAFDSAWQLCEQETAKAERRTGVPKNLLKAISQAESGRWDAQNQENIAWPWTVTSGGQGQFFDTKAEAMAEVEFLMTEGVRNIDVGCMQVNLHYHGEAFETLDEAFEPQANAAYAASYLKNMYALTGNWPEAAGYYHSMTPDRNGPYKEKVLAFWRRNGGNPPAKSPNSPSISQYAPVDHIRMARLNDRFKARTLAQRDPTNGVPGKNALEITRSRQLQAWRDANSKGLGSQHMIAMRQAETTLKRKREMDRLTNGDPKTRFKEKRAKQLSEWRDRVAGRTSLSAHDRLKGLQRAKAFPATSIAAAAAGAALR
ncbi:MAG: transglycosylase SLT domain-containing protein [Rhodospirillales bacterium]|nr:transglycosylase SLT domain-containing protein [Rhodospirillales bacterium]